MSTSIVKAKKELTNILSDNEQFKDAYGDMVEGVISRLPTQRDIADMLDQVPEDLQTKIVKIATKMSGQRIGQYGEQEGTFLTELKLYQGTGKDPNRPEKQIPGELYLTSKVSVGEVFTGTVLTTTNGHTMWEDANDKVPKCLSLDRRVGNTYGDCTTCVHRPWRNRHKQACNKDIIAYLVPDTLDDILFARFASTSERTGKRLIEFINKTGGINWYQWYNFSSKETTNKEGKRYYLWNIEPVSGDNHKTPKELDAFFNALCAVIEATYVLPSLARIYEQAKDSEENAKEEENSPGIDDSEGEEGANYSDIPNAPKDNNDINM